MNHTYVTFGQDHTHIVGGQTFNKDTVAVIEHEGDGSQGRDLAFKIFGSKFCFEYFEDEFNLADIHYFPRGLVKIHKDCIPDLTTPNR